MCQATLLSTYLRLAVITLKQAARLNITKSGALQVSLTEKREADTREHRPGSDYQELGGEEQGEMVKCWEDGRSEGWQSLVGFVGFSS